MPEQMHIKYRGRNAFLRYEDKEGNTVDLLVMTVTRWGGFGKADVEFLGATVQEQLRTACTVAAELMGLLREHRLTRWDAPKESLKTKPSQPRKRSAR